MAATGGIGIDASNTNFETGKPAETPEEAGKPVTEGAKKIIGDQVVEGEGSGGSTDQTGDQVEIPDNWKELSWQERRSLAAKVSDTAISNGDEANAAIEAELKRRG